jgi:hypothetical protein
LSSHDLKNRASSAIRASIGVAGFGKLRRFVRAERLRKNKSSLVQGIFRLQNRQQRARRHQT